MTKKKAQIGYEFLDASGNFIFSDFLLWAYVWNFISIQGL